VRIVKILAICGLFFLSGCTAMEVARQVQSGRAALRVRSPKAAIPHFEAGARLDPDYITAFSPLQVGIWTYLGMANYDAGDRTKAVENLKRARDRYSDDYLARIYLGLIMAGDSQRAEGIKEMEVGLKGLKEWLDGLPGHDIDGKYWDPGRYMSKSMAETLTLLKAETVDWKEVRENIRWLARNLDETVEEARRRRERDTGAGSNTR
jgi:tetratricopeptide (TPR) repeat protein